MTPTATATQRDASWVDAIAEGGERDLLLHLDQHGVVTESEASRFLGGARQVRRFANRFDELSKRLPFRVKTEGTPNGRRYVKQGDA